MGGITTARPVGADIIRPFAPATTGPVGRDKVNCPNGAREGALGYGPARRPFAPATTGPVGRDDPARRSFTGVPPASYGFSGSTGISPCSFSYCSR